MSGPGLAPPALLADWSENGFLLSTLVNAPRAKVGVRQRPRFDLALFWGWPEKPRPTRPGQANRHGWFYPAHGLRPAVVDLMVDGLRTPRLVPARALRILAQHGVPTRL